MATVREVIKRLNDAWIDSNEEHYLHVWMAMIVLCVGGIMVFMLYSQTQRIDILKKDNVTLMEQLNIATAELISIKAQVDSNSSPVIMPQQRQIDSVIESGTQEIKEKVKDIQKELVNSPVTQPKPIQQRNTTPDTKIINKSLLDSFCKDNQDHQSCRGKI